MWLIDKELELLEILKEHARTNARLETDVEARSLALRSADATEKLLRYEAHLERQLYRAMDQLERLQRRRTGSHRPFMKGSEVSREADTLMGRGAVATVFPSGVNSTVDVTSRLTKPTPVLECC